MQEYGTECGTKVRCGPRAIITIRAYDDDGARLASSVPCSVSHSCVLAFTVSRLCFGYTVLRVFRYILKRAESL